MGLGATATLFLASFFITLAFASFAYFPLPDVL
jgi:hypothetical protein